MRAGEKEVSSARAGRGTKAHVLLLADGKDADGDERAPEEREARRLLGEPEVPPDVLPLCVSGEVSARLG